MLDARDPDLDTAPPAEATIPRAARFASDRLAEQMSAWDRRSASDPSEGSLPTAPPGAVELARGVPAQPAPAPAADEPAVEPERLTASPAVAADPAPGRAVAAGSMAAAPGPISGAPPVANGADGLDAGPPSTRLSGRPADLPASAPAVPVAANLGAAGPIAPASYADPDPAAEEDGSVPGAPGVRGRMPAAVAGLALASAGPPESVAAGPAGGSWGPAGAGTGFDAMTPPTSGGATGVDEGLAHTNELLQQILDAIRKQGTTDRGSLPAGGSPVYAERY